jgi:hypothetical protein
MLHMLVFYSCISMSQSEVVDPYLQYACHDSHIYIYILYTCIHAGLAAWYKFILKHQLDACTCAMFFATRAYTPNTMQFWNVYVWMLHPDASIGCAIGCAHRCSALCHHSMYFWHNAILQCMCVNAYPKALIRCAHMCNYLCHQSMYLQHNATL